VVWVSEQTDGILGVMTRRLDQDAALMRATGIIRSFHAGEQDHVKAVVEADQSTSETFAALVAIAGLLAGELAIERKSTIEQVLRDTLRLAQE